MTCVSMPHIHTLGDFGSQISQYVSMLSIADVNNKKLIFPESIKQSQEGHGFRIIKALDLDINFVNENFNEPFSVIHHNSNLEVDYQVFNLKSDTNYIFANRFDNYKYWYDHIKEKVFNIRFLKEIEEESEAILKNIKSQINNRAVVSLHVRRGDYLNKNHYNVFCQLDETYYKEAINQVEDKNSIFLIFSNDIDWCKEHINNLSNNIYIENSKSDYIDMCLMSKCDHNIIANSSFSYWAAILNKNNNKVICPKNYLQKTVNISNILNNNYFPPDWIAINNED